MLPYSWSQQLRSTWNSSLSWLSSDYRFWYPSDLRRVLSRSYVTIHTWLPHFHEDSFSSLLCQSVPHVLMLELARADLMVSWYANSERSCFTLWYVAGWSDHSFRMTHCLTVEGSTSFSEACSTSRAVKDDSQLRPQLTSQIPPSRYDNKYPQLPAAAGSNSLRHLTVHLYVWLSNHRVVTPVQILALGHGGSH